MENPQRRQNFEMDPLGAAIPGQSLTATPGQFPWEKPPMTADPVQALEVLLEQINSPPARKNLKYLLESGITAETVASAFVMGGVSEGMFDPNVAELVKIPLVVYIVNIGDEEGVEDINVTNTKPSEGMQDVEGFNLVNNIAPDERAVKFNDKTMKKGKEAEEMLKMMGMVEMEQEQNAQDEIDGKIAVFKQEQEDNQGFISQQKMQKEEI